MNEDKQRSVAENICGDAVYLPRPLVRPPADRRTNDYGALGRISQHKISNTGIYSG